MFTVAHARRYQGSRGEFTQKAGACYCVACHIGQPIPERPRSVQAGLCADCIDEHFEPWDQVLDELEALNGTK